MLNGQAYRIFVEAINAYLAGTEDEAEYFYSAYDRLWELGAYIEAYSLMRMVFGIMNKTTIEQLRHKGHLFTTEEVFSYARQRI